MWTIKKLPGSLSGINKAGRIAVKAPHWDLGMQREVSVSSLFLIHHQLALLAIIGAFLPLAQVHPPQAVLRGRSPLSVSNALQIVGIWREIPVLVVFFSCH